MEINKIIQVGNSLAVVVPAGICRSLDLRRGSYVEVRLAHDDIIEVEKVVERGEVEEPEITSCYE